MSRETLLDEAIAKAKEAEDWQLVEWLRMARGSESAAKWYSDKLRDAHRIERKLMNENAKLRELLRDMNKWLWNGADCTECPFAAKCDLNAAFESDLHANVCLGWSEIHRRMRELGVEV